MAFKYRCKNCEGFNLEVKQIGKRTGVYCKDCRSWIQWLNQKEIREVYQFLKRYNYENNKVFRIFKRFDDGHLIMKCSNCNCILYNSEKPDQIGHFNLAEAKYCPQCGSELY